MFKNYILHFIFVFPGYITNQFNCLSQFFLLPQLVGALHQYCKGHEVAISARPEFFPPFFSQLLTVAYYSFQIKISTFSSCKQYFNYPSLFHFYFPPLPQFYYFPSSIFSFPPPQFHNFKIFPPPPLPLLYISIVFPPPPPPPPHFYNNKIVEEEENKNEKERGK